MMIRWKSEIANSAILIFYRVLGQILQNLFFYKGWFILCCESAATSDRQLHFCREIGNLLSTANYQQIATSLNKPKHKRHKITARL